MKSLEEYEKKNSALKLDDIKALGIGKIILAAIIGIPCMWLIASIVLLIALPILNALMPDLGPPPFPVAFFVAILGGPIIGPLVLAGIRKNKRLNDK